MWRQRPRHPSIVLARAPAFAPQSSLAVSALVICSVTHFLWRFARWKLGRQSRAGLVEWPLGYAHPAAWEVGRHLAGFQLRLEVVAWVAGLASPAALPYWLPSLLCVPGFGAALQLLPAAGVVAAGELSYWLSALSLTAGVY